MKIKKISLAICGFIFLNSVALVLSEMDVVAYWNYIDYVWPEPAQITRRQAIVSGRYIPKNILPLDVDVSKGILGMIVLKLNFNK